MDKKKVIKFMINVLPIVLVPLIFERKRIKQHPDVQKVTDATSKVASKTSAAISNTASDVKEYVGDKKQDFENKRELKKFAREHDPAYIEKKGEKLAKQNRKDADKARIKSFKKYKDYVAKSASQQNKENNTEA
ncbi:hypothetical protein AB0993_00840 [Staphylococcus aureus]|uniref:hypothetical protein n=1 Tax=Staphylococcus aureus TaxID=1280 RepID=UPI0034550E61